MVAQMTERDMVLRQIAEMEAKLAAASDQSHPHASLADTQGMQRCFCGFCQPQLPLTHMHAHCLRSSVSSDAFESFSTCYRQWTHRYKVTDELRPTAMLYL